MSQILVNTNTHTHVACYTLTQHVGNIMHANGMHVMHAGRGQSPTVTSAAATAIAAVSAASSEDLERFVDAGALAGLTRGLASGTREEAATCAAALAVLARLPSAHAHLLRSSACDVLLRCAGSRVCSHSPQSKQLNV